MIVVIRIEITHENKLIIGILETEKLHKQLFTWGQMKIDYLNLYLLLPA